ncbi:MAG: carboxypeptidase regulatory-like domain-containing protein [Cyanobacteriota bacterium]|nr:carboxypeptidase regulatory-like domain-containing protein [Cyanobacteriota bacterium]
MRIPSVLLLLAISLTCLSGETIAQTDPLPSFPQLLATPSPLSSPEAEITLPLASAADRIDLWINPLNPEERLVALGELSEQSVQLLDLATGQPRWQLSVGFAASVVRIDPLNQWVYASGPDAPGLVVIDLLTGELVKAYGLASGALDIDFDAASQRVFATMPAASSVAVIQLGETQARNLPMPGSPLALAYDATRQNLLVSLAGEDPLSLLVVNPENGERLARWRSGTTPEDMVIDSTGQQLVVLNSGSQDLSVVDLNRNGEIVQRIGLEWRPTRLTLSADGQQVLVTARDSDRLQVVSLDTLRLEATYNLGKQPTGIAYLPTPMGSGVVVVEAGIPRLRWLRLPNLAVATLRQASPATGAVSGRVLDIAGNPVQTGSLQLVSRDRTQQEQAIAADGSYLIRDLQPGVYLIDVQVPGFPPTSTQIQVRAGFVSSQDIRLPPADPLTEATGIGLLPDAPPFSDELARHLAPALAQLQPDREVILLNGPVGPADAFQNLLPLIENLTLLDRDERYTDDLAKLQVIGNTLGLRYIVLTQMQISQDYSRQGSSLLNTALRFVAPMVPVEIPNFTPNQLRSRGLVVIVDLQKERPGDKARYYEAYGRDDVGGDPLFEDAAAGLFRLQVRNMVPVFVQQWQSNPPFAG